MDITAHSKEQLRIENKRLRRKVEDCKSALIYSQMLLDAIDRAVSGSVVSDFELSEPLVRAVWDMKHFNS